MAYLGEIDGRRLTSKEKEHLRAIFEQHRPSAVGLETDCCLVCAEVALWLNREGPHGEIRPAEK